MQRRLHSENCVHYNLKTVCATTTQKMILLLGFALKIAKLCEFLDLFSRKLVMSTFWKRVTKWQRHWPLLQLTIWGKMVHMGFTLQTNTVKEKFGYSIGRLRKRKVLNHRIITKMRLIRRKSATTIVKSIIGLANWTTRQLNLCTNETNTLSGSVETALVHNSVDIRTNIRHRGSTILGTNRHREENF